MSQKEIIGYSFLGDLYADAVEGCVLRDGHSLDKPLTEKEFEVLYFFLGKAGALVKRQEVEPLKTARVPGQRHGVDNYISDINTKLGWKRHQYFKLVRGKGYRLEVIAIPKFKADLDQAGRLNAVAEQNFNDHMVASMRAALDHSLRALKLDPFDPKANTTAAYNYINLSHVAYCADPPIDNIPKARQAALIALEKHPNYGPAYGVLGLINLIYDYNWVEAEARLMRALALDDGDTAAMLSYAHLLVSTGRADEAIKYIRTAADLDITDKIVQATWPWMLLMAGKLAEADQLSAETLSLYPDFPPSLIIRGWICEACDNYEEAVKRYKRSLKVDPSPIAVAALGHIQGIYNKRAEAHAALGQLEAMQKKRVTAFVSSYCKALVYAGLGDSERVSTSLEMAFAEHCDWLIHLCVEPRWQPFRSDKRFQELAARVHIPGSDQLLKQKPRL